MDSLGEPPSTGSSMDGDSDAHAAGSGAGRRGFGVGLSKRISSWLALILLAGLFWNVRIFVGVQAQKRPGTGSKSTDPPAVTGVPVKFHEDHRTIQWCVNGIDEPEFHKFPWNEFVPIIQRKYYSNFKANVRYSYSVGLWPITNTAGYGMGMLHQRAHFYFNVKLRKEFETGVNLEYYNHSVIEGLLVQANFAPFGVGLPIGQFTHPKKFNCVDCVKPVGIPIACRRRTYMHVVHPTIMVYHHSMKPSILEREKKKTYCLNKLTPKQCILTGFEDSKVDKTPTVPPPPVMLKYYDWATIFAKYLGQPHPGLADQCTSAAECEDKHVDWFKKDCCQASDGDICNNTVGAGGADPVKQFCPNKGFSAIPSPTAPTGDIVKESPKLQSNDWPVFDCKPYIISVCRPPNFQKIPLWETLEDLQRDYTKATFTNYPKSPPPAPPGFDPFSLAEQCCMVPPGEPCPPPPTPSNPSIPAPGSKSCPKEDKNTGIARTECVYRVVPPIDRETWDDKFEDKSQKDAITECGKDEFLTVNGGKTDVKPYGTTNEVHGNFVWHLSPCIGEKVKIRFRYLVVHSFQRGIYSIQETDFFELKSGHVGAGDKNLNKFIPTPLFTAIAHTCETSVGITNSLFGIIPATDKDTFDFSRSYDQCVQNITGPKHANEQICSGVPIFTPDSGKKKKGNRPTTTATYKYSLVPKCDLSKLDIDDHPNCEFNCPTLPATTPEYVSTPSNRVIKRTLHGAINIITNFCVMPICVFVARFYKETYNLSSFKGAKTWYWMHMVGAGGSTIFMYMGYFTDKFVDNADAHLIYGNTYIICLGLSYMTSWMRHKNRYISMIVESTHSVCGYCCFILALICVTNAKHNEEPISSEVKYVVYAAIASLTVFYVGMTVHICSMDRKFGMKPARWHFPSVEARFDDLPVPGRNVRKIFIFLVLFINLPLTISTLFL